MQVGTMANRTNVGAGARSANVLLGEPLAFLFRAAFITVYANADVAAAGTVLATFKSGQNTPMDDRPINPAATAGIINPLDDVILQRMPARGQLSLRFTNNDAAARNINWRVDVAA